MKKFVFSILACALFAVIVMPKVSAAVGEDAVCESFTSPSGVVVSVCFEGEVSSEKVSNKLKSRVIDLAKLAKKSAAGSAKKVTTNKRYGAAYMMEQQRQQEAAQQEAERTAQEEYENQMAQIEDYYNNGPDYGDSNDTNNDYKEEGYPLAGGPSTGCDFGCS